MRWPWHRDDPAQRRRLERAQAETAELLERVDRITQTLSERQARNHWAESIDALLKGH